LNGEITDGVQDQEIAEEYSVNMSQRNVSKSVGILDSTKDRFDQLSGAGRALRVYVLRLCYQMKGMRQTFHTIFLVYETIARCMHLSTFVV
jgi:hypothetical protein